VESSWTGRLWFGGSEDYYEVHMLGAGQGSGVTKSIKAGKTKGPGLKKMYNGGRDAGRGKAPDGVRRGVKSKGKQLFKETLEVVPYGVLVRGCVAGGPGDQDKPMGPRRSSAVPGTSQQGGEAPLGRTRRRQTQRYPWAGQGARPRYTYTVPVRAAVLCGKWENACHACQRPVFSLWPAQNSVHGPPPARLQPPPPASRESSLCPFRQRGLAFCL